MLGTQLTQPQYWVRATTMSRQNNGTTHINDKTTQKCNPHVHTRRQLMYIPVNSDIIYLGHMASVPIEKISPWGKKGEEKNWLKNTSQKIQTNNRIKATGSHLRSLATTGETNSQRSMHVQWDRQIDQSWIQQHGKVNIHLASVAIVAQEWLRLAQHPLKYLTNYRCKQLQLQPCTLFTCSFYQWELILQLVICFTEIRQKIQQENDSREHSLWYIKVLHNSFENWYWPPGETSVPLRPRFSATSPSFTKSP